MSRIGAPTEAELLVERLQARLGVQRELVRLVARRLEAVLPRTLDLVDRGVLQHALDDLVLMLGPACRVCGCTEGLACEGGCGWSEDDLCTACADDDDLVVVVDTDTDTDTDGDELADWET